MTEALKEPLLKLAPLIKERLQGTYKGQLEISMVPIVIHDKMSNVADLTVEELVKKYSQLDLYKKGMIVVITPRGGENVPYDALSAEIQIGKLRILWFDIPYFASALEFQSGHHLLLLGMSVEDSDHVYLMGVLSKGKDSLLERSIRVGKSTFMQIKVSEIVPKVVELLGMKDEVEEIAEKEVEEEFKSTCPTCLE